MSGHLAVILRSFLTLKVSERSSQISDCRRGWQVTVEGVAQLKCYDSKLGLTDPS